jgi:calcineurin-like phosphoesterase family protein
MNIFYTSDLHFGHNRGFLYEPRGFKTIQEHDAAIIENWNKIVKDNDIVYLLGDTMLNDNDNGIKCLNALNGHIWFICGNHDTSERIYRIYHDCPNIRFLGSDNELNCACAYKYKEKGFNLYLSHYPTITSSVENMAPLKHHIINLHGHIHSKNKFYQDMPFCYNVTLDAHNNTPVSFDKIIADIAYIVNCST